MDKRERSDSDCVHCPVFRNEEDVQMCTLGFFFGYCPYTAQGADNCRYYRRREQ